MELSQTELMAKKLADALMVSDEYKRFKSAEKKLKDFPGLYDEVNRFRKSNLDMQQDENADLFATTDRIEQEYQELRENKYVQDFLTAELAFCRLYQRINYTILENLDFDVDFLRQ